jgi:hypothetical protein
MHKLRKSGESQGPELMKSRERCAGKVGTRFMIGLTRLLPCDDGYQRGESAIKPVRVCQHRAKQAPNILDEMSPEGSPRTTWLVCWAGGSTGQDLYQLIATAGPSAPVLTATIDSRG